MTEVIMKLRKCAEDLSQIADALARKTSAASTVDLEEVKQRAGGDARRVVETLALFGVDVKVERTRQGPTFSKIEVSLPPGCRYSSITNLRDNLMGALKKHSIRIEAPVPGSDAVGIEFDREDPEAVTFGETTVPELSRLVLLPNRPELPIVVGRNVDRASVSFDLATMPHLLVGGATGQGKSMFIHGLINGLISTRSPEEIRLMLFDPKHVEYLAYTNLPHLVVPVLNENRRLGFALHWAVAEMEKRLKMFAHARVRNIREYNGRKIPADGQSKDIPERVPSVVIVLDEISDAMHSCGKEIVPNIVRLTTKARSVGIHLVLVTQLPECKVVTDTLKANIPGRIAFKTVGPLESRVLIDDSGAEGLIGKGDCLYRDRDGVLHRVQVPYISDEEIAANVERAIAKYSSLLIQRH